jgi:hypothetical protein
VRSVRPERHLGAMPHVVMHAHSGTAPAFIVCAPSRRSVTLARGSTPGACDHRRARLDALDPETAPVLYGQSARFVRAILPAAEVVATASEEAERILRTRPAALLD